MKKLLAMVLTAVMSLTFMTGCLQNQTLAPSSSAASSEPSSTAPSSETSSANTNVRVFKLGNAGAVGEPAAQVCQLFCDMANDRLKGQIVFEFYPAEQLGNEVTMLENLQVDLQQAMMCAIDTLANYSPDLNIISMAFAFENHDHLFKYLESDLSKPAFDKLEEQGIHVLSYNFKKNPRILFGKKPFVTAADMKGVKFRIPNIPIFEKNIRQMGATPTVVAWSEYPFALMQGVVDAGECTKEAMYSCKFYESCKYISEVDYGYPLEALSFSSQAWNSLTPEQQQILEECAAAASEEFNTVINNKWEDDKKKLIEEGVTFVDFDKQAFIDQMAPLAAQLEAENFWDTPGLYEKVQQLKG